MNLAGRNLLQLPGVPAEFQAEAPHQPLEVKHA
jgi:hypothetical protein